MVAIRMFGLAWRVEYSEIEDFYREFKFVERSIVLGKGDDGRNNGLGAILFEDEEQASKAAEELNKAYIGTRYVNLNTMSYGEWKTFNDEGGRGKMGGGGGQRKSYDNEDAGGEDENQLAKLVTAEVMDKALIMKGLPFRVQMDEIVDFFDGYGKVTEENIVIEQQGRRRTGQGAIVFESAEMAQSAKEDKNKQEIGDHGRWVLLCDQDDGFFK